MEIISKNELKVLNLFRKDLFLKDSIRGVSKRLKSNSYQRVYEAISSLRKKNILRSENIGNLSLISLGLSRETIMLLSFLDESDALKIPNYSKIIEIKEISKHLVLVTGSYAKGTQTKKSDLDLVVIIPEGESVVALQKLIENKTLLLTPKVHLFVFTFADFLQMLTSTRKNYGKEIVKHKILIKNAQFFYEILKEAIQNGYNC